MPDSALSSDTPNPLAGAGDGDAAAEGSARRVLTGSGWRGWDWRKWAWRFGPPVLYLAAAMYCYSGFVTDARNRLSGGADGIAYAWYFEWVHQSVVHLDNPFISHAMNAPTGINMTWSAWMPLLGVLCVPLTATFGAFTTVGLMLLIAPVLSATSLYWVLRRMTGASAGAAIAGALFGFGPYNTGHFGHLNLTFLPLLPVMLFLLHKLLVTQAGSAVRTGLLLGALVGMQMLLSEEIVVLLVAAAVPLVAWLVLLNLRELPARWRHVVAGLGSAAGVSAVIVAIPLAYQLFGPLALHGGTRPSMAAVDVASVVRPSLLQHFASTSDIRANLHYSANGAENTGYLGWFLIAACLLLCAWLVFDRDRFAMWWLLAIGSTLLLSFGSQIFVDGHHLVRGPWSAYKFIPFMHSAQAVRMSLMTMLLICWLVCRSIGRMHGWLRVAAPVLVVGALVPLLPVAPYAADKLPETPRFFQTAAVEAIPRGATTMVLPVPGFPHVEAMAWQIRAHMRFNLIGGYSMFNRGGVSSYFPEVPVAWAAVSAIERTGRPLNSSQIDASRRSLRQFGVHYIVVTHKMKRFDAVLDGVEAMGQCRMRLVADVGLCEVGSRP